MLLRAIPAVRPGAMRRMALEAAADPTPIASRALTSCRRGQAPPDNGWQSAVSFRTAATCRHRRACSGQRVCSFRPLVACNLRVVACSVSRAARGGDEPANWGCQGEARDAHRGASELRSQGSAPDPDLPRDCGGERGRRARRAPRCRWGSPTEPSRCEPVTCCDRAAIEDAATFVSP